MTNNEKIEYYDALQILRQKISGCFGSADGLFALNPSDEIRAKELKALAVSKDITLNDIQDIALGYLYRKDYSVEHIKKQMGVLVVFWEIR